MTTTTAPPRSARLLTGLAVLLHLLVAWPYSASGLVAPGWAVLGLGVVWIALLVLLLRIARTRPPLALLVPPAALALWFGALTAGEQLLGWTG